VYLSTGLVAENHAREAGISRDEQDAFALRSHQRALAAIDAGTIRRRDHAVDVQSDRIPVPDPRSPPSDP
jgi:acetyl-CoA acetyltransferase